MTLAAFLDLLEQVRPAGAGYTASCPSHDDKKASLSVTEKDAKILVNCHAAKGCTADSITAALGLTLKDLHTDGDTAVPSAPTPQRDRRPSAGPASSRIIASYDYVDESGELLYQNVRLEPKRFFQRRPHADRPGEYINGLGAGWYERDTRHGTWRAVRHASDSPGLRPHPSAVWFDAQARVLYKLRELRAAMKVARDEGRPALAIYCYDRDTEVLTPEGWIPFPKLDPLARVAQWSPSGRVDFVLPLAHQTFETSGPLVSLTANWLDLLVTPEHRMVFQRGKLRGNQVAPAVAFLGAGRRVAGTAPSFPVSGILDVWDHLGPTSHEVRLLAAYQADGHRPKRGQQITWNLKKQRKKERLRSLLLAAGVVAQESTAASTPGWTLFTIQRTQLPMLDRYLPDKRWPWTALAWSFAARLALLEELAHWDGDHSGRAGIRFFTAERQNADVVSALAAITGFGAILRADVRPEKGTTYVVNLVGRTWRQAYRPAKWVPYAGPVYCCTVPSGFLVVRRHGKTVIAGNCEGEKDVEAAWALGVPATTHTAGAKSFTPFADTYVSQLGWARVPLVVGIPDNDDPGRALMRDIGKACLGSLGGPLTFKYLTLPGVPEKGDLSDWIQARRGEGLADEGIRTALLDLIESTPLAVRAALEAPVSDPAGAPQNKLPDVGADYVVIEGRLCLNRRVKDQLVPDWLCNFTAEIVEDRTEDPGLGEGEVKHVYVLQGVLHTGEPLRPIEVTAEQFAAMAWVDQWGAGVLIRAGQGRRDHVRAAIQARSRARRRRVYLHTGWVLEEVEGEEPTYRFLSGSGAVGADDYNVELPGALARYSLPARVTDARAAMRASLALWHIGPLAVTIPLWAGMFRAPLSTLIPSDFTLWVAGRTGQKKSSLTAIFLGHFGRFRLKSDHLLHWSATENFLEALLNLLKDVPACIDDYTLERAADPREVIKKAQRIIRAQGNYSGRGRMRADASTTAPRPPRGLLVSSGEGVPPGESVAARLLILELPGESIHLERLTAAQMPEAAERLGEAMVGYLQWLGPQMGNGLRTELVSTFEDTRQSFQGGTKVHARVPEIAAHLWLGLMLGLDYAEEIGALSHADRERHEADAFETFRRVSAGQAEAVGARRATLVYFQALESLVQSGKVRIVRRNARLRPTDRGTQKPIVGWADEEHLHMQPEGSLAQVMLHRRDMADTFPLELERLGRELVEEGLATPGSDGRTSVKQRNGGFQPRVYLINRAALEKAMGRPFVVPEVDIPESGSDPGQVSETDSDDGGGRRGMFG